jgi:hypothetical protein
LPLSSNMTAPVAYVLMAASCRSTLSILLVSQSIFVFVVIALVWGAYDLQGLSCRA